MFTIVGLGNPGEKYDGTRHNAGRDAVRAWVETRGGAFVASKKYHGVISEGQLGKVAYLALLPDTYMNESGGSVKKAVTSKAAAERLILVHDELDLPLGTIRIAFDRGSGGHNGVRSVEEMLKTKRFTRIRIGISATGKDGVQKPKGAHAVLKSVMGVFSKVEQKSLAEAIARTGEAIECVLKDGVSVAMNRYNGS